MQLYNKKLYVKFVLQVEVLVSWKRWRGLIRRHVEREKNVPN